MSKQFMKFTKGSAQIKVTISVQGTSNTLDIEALTNAASHKAYDQVNIILGEYCQVQKFNVNFSAHGLFKIKNLMKNNTVNIIDLKSTEELEFPKAINNAKEKTHFDLGDMYTNRFCSESAYKFYSRKLRAAFGPTEDVMDVDNNLDYTAMLLNTMNSNKGTEAFNRILQNHSRIAKSINNNFNFIAPYFIQTRMETELIAEVSFKEKQLKELMQLIELSESELDAYVAGNNFTPMTYAVPNYGMKFNYAGKSGMRSLQDSYMTYYLGNKYTHSGADELEAKLVEYMAREAYGIYMPTYSDQVKRLQELQALAVHTRLPLAMQDEKLRLEFELGTVLIGSPQVMEAAVYTSKLVEDDEHRTFQVIAEDEKASRHITASTPVAEDTNATASSMFDHMVKRYHTFTQK